MSQFTEEFDFTFMNEKFNKDEVWGPLGKAKLRSTLGSGMEENPIHDHVEVEEGYGQDPKLGRKVRHVCLPFFYVDCSVQQLNITQILYKSTMLKNVEILLDEQVKVKPWLLAG